MGSEHFDMVCLGGGVAAGYWAEEVVSLIKASGRSGSSRPKLGIISSYPEGLAPYERSELSKDCLRQANTHGRDWQAWGNRTFPYTSTGNNREARYSRWYRDHGVTILYWCECYEANVANGTLKILQYADRARTRAKAKVLTITYDALLIATGSSARRLHGDKEGPCSCIRHRDLRGVRIEKQDNYGLGSAHYLRDMGDCIKLVKALGTAPLGGGDTGGHGRGDGNTVAVVGGGILGIEAVAAIATHYRGIRPVLLVAKSRLMPDLFSEELSDFYEARLAEAGVRIEKNVRAERLWGLEEQGEFETLEGYRVHFGAAPRGFSECRGVVLRSQSNRLVHVPARVVLLCIGAAPNSDLFRGQLDVSEDGGVCVDARCRVVQSPMPKSAAVNGSRATVRPVYAAGDVAAYPLALEGSRRVRHEHIQNARDMAVVAARNMIAEAAAAAEGAGSRNTFTTSKSKSAGYQLDGAEEALYQPVPGFSSKFLGLSWRFYGVAEGEVVVLGAADFRTTRTFGAFWVRGERVVGAFLEGGTLEQQIAVAQVTRLRPKVFSCKVLKDAALGDFLEDPGSIEAEEESDLAQLLMCCRCV